MTDLQNANKDANKIIENILGRGIDWFDYHGLDKGRWEGYKADAKFITACEVFTNELNHYITDLIKFIAYESKDFDQVLHIRTAIVTLETFKQRLESIEEPNEQQTNERPYESI